MVRPGRLPPTPGSVLKALLEKLQNDVMFALLMEGDPDSAAFARKSLESLKRTSTFVFAVVGHLPVSKVVFSLIPNRLGSINRDNSTMT
jgi:hypothetical protein